MDFKRYGVKRISYAKWRTSDEGLLWIQMLRDEQSNLCFICVYSLEERVHIDHLKSLYKGGNNNLKNMALTHPSCNMKKGASDMYSKEDIKNKRSMFYRIKEGLRLHNLSVETGVKPTAKQLDTIIFASQYYDLR